MDDDTEQFRDLRPPFEPWRPLIAARPEHSYVSYYYADELGRLPVRAITRLKDNKSDPNLETGTYGLFSTCQERMRSGIVTSRPRYVFFVCKPRDASRQLTGYYEIGWYTPGALRRRARDFALAAGRMRFIDPIELADLPCELATELTPLWRLTKRLGPEHTAALRDLIDGRRDRTAAYVAEVDRLERVNAYHSGYRYPSWRRIEPFRWSDAERYLREPPEDPDAPAVRNSSPTGWWRCTACPERTQNKALLKACPYCHSTDTLRPLAAHEMKEGS